MVGISRNPREFYALFKCAGLANAVNATTVLSRCFPGNPGIARFWLADGDEQTYLPDDKKLELTRDELAEVLRATHTVTERGYI